MQNFDLASAYVAALAGDVNAVMDWRCLSDVDRGAPGQVHRGTLAQSWDWLCAWNQQQHGCFVTVSEMDGHGRELSNVSAVRAHIVDHDSIDAIQQSNNAAKWSPAPTFRVHSSPGKSHTYWSVSPYQDNERFKTVQRKLRQLFNGDKSVIDATRVLRVPGTVNWKYTEPFLSHCEALPGYGQPTTVEQLEAALAHITVIDGSGERKELGDPTMAAPSLSWLKRAMELVDPNELGRDEWLGLSAAIKQAGWTLTDPDALYVMWSEWCGRYDTGKGNDAAENHKMWRSMERTELGWQSLLNRVPSLKAAMSFGEQGAPNIAALPTPGSAPATPPMPEPQPLDCSGPYLTHIECKEWFKGCVFVGAFGKIMLPNGKLYGPGQFNGSQYAGKKFIWTDDQKTTHEPWKAALQSQLFQIPKVDHLRFLPERAPSEIVIDVLGRKGVNTYVKPDIELVEGDVTPFLNHIAAIIPDEGDRKILFDWMAHVVKFPGFKIPWAPVIQSVEGIGKGVIKLAMTHAVGQPYVHFPDAQQLGDSGGKFNAWMRNKVFILADEIKVDEKRHLVEVLKPLISEELIEIQGKGNDQEMEDNPSCWAFFTNYKDAVPVSRNGRRYAIFYSPIQTEDDLFARGMDDGYFKALFDWLKADGAKHIAHWLHNYPIERGALPMRAPRTTSWIEAVKISRSPIERSISEAIETNAAGFAGGWVSEIAVMNRLRETGATKGQVPPHVIAGILTGMGYRDSGRQVRPYIQEDKDRTGVLYFREAVADPIGYGIAQGYE